MPLLLAFHGGIGTGQSMAEKTGFSPLADQKCFVVTYPDGLDKRWHDGGSDVGNDIGFVRALIDELLHTLSIDSDRIYATGGSNGGMFTHRLGCELSDVLAAIATVSGTMNVEVAPTCAPAQPLSLIMFHGTDDPRVPWDGGAVVSPAAPPGTHLVLSVHDTLDKWGKRGGCSATPTSVEQLPDIDPNDGTRIRRDEYAPCSSGVDVVLYAIEGGGHGWPGREGNPGPGSGVQTRDIDATPVIWDFFAAHSKIHERSLRTLIPVVTI